MKKAKTTQGEYIPRNQNSGSRNDSKTNTSGGLDKLGNLIGSLDPSQVTQLFSSLSDTYGANLDLRKEELKTLQVETEVKLGMRKVIAEEKAAKLQYKKNIAVLELKNAKDQRRHDETMNELQSAANKQGNESEQIFRVLDLVENGLITSNDLAQLIHQIKVK